MCVLGMAGEFRDEGVAFNALWPQTTIATAAIQNIVGGDEMMKKSRTPDIMADAGLVYSHPAEPRLHGSVFC